MDDGRPGQARRGPGPHGLGEGDEAEAGVQDVAAAIGLARTLGTLPSRLVVYAIEAGHSGAGEGLSPEVDRAAHEVVTLVTQDADGRAGPP